MIHQFFHNTAVEISLGVTLFLLANVGVAWLIIREPLGHRRSEDPETDGR